MSLVLHPYRQWNRSEPQSLTDPADESCASDCDIGRQDNELQEGGRAPVSPAPPPRYLEALLGSIGMADDDLLSISMVLAVAAQNVPADRFHRCGLVHAEG